MSKLLNEAIRDDGLISNVKKAVETKTASFTYAVGDAIPLINTTAGDVTMTMPAITDWDDEAFRNEIELAHVAGANDVIIQLDGVETFAWGNTYLNLGNALKGFTLAALNYGALETYGLLRNITIRAESHREASWAAANFSSMTIIPWDAEESNNQDELLVYTAGAAARYTVLAAGDYEINYTIDIDSTGGSTWNAAAQVYKNGVALDNTEVRTGNYGSEDQSMCLPNKTITLAAGDYIDLRIDQYNLTGNLVHSMFNISIRL